MLHPLVAVGMLIAVLLILILPREKAITPFLLAVFTIPLGQVLVLGGVHLTMHQILIMTVLGRMAMFRRSSSEGRFAGGFNALDSAVLLWATLELLMLCLEWMDTRALIKGLGDLVINMGAYVAVRFLVPDRDAVLRAIKTFALIAVIQGACMVSEQLTHDNVFNSFGANQPTIREGKVRSEGALDTLHGGTIAGVSIPLFLWLWTERKSRIVAYAGLAGATAMVFASHASTSWMAYGASVGGLCFWPLRRRMRLVRWALVAILVGLHLTMNGPVWSLIEKIDLTGGSSSYHRYMLVDNCIRHFTDWWLIGYTHYGDWGFDMWDLCNQFVVAALTGGLVTLIVFIAIYKRGFAAIGTARRDVEGDRQKEWFCWCLGSVLFANVVASFGINYVGHLIIFFFLLLVCISVASSEAGQATPERMDPSEQFAYAGGSLEEGAPVGPIIQETW